MRARNPFSLKYLMNAWICLGVRVWITIPRSYFRRCEPNEFCAVAFRWYYLI